VVDVAAGWGAGDDQDSLELLGRSEEDNANQRLENNDDKPESTGAELGEATSSDTIEAGHDHDRRALDGDSGENDPSDGAGNGSGDGDDAKDGLVTEPVVETAVAEDATPVAETAVVHDATEAVVEFGGDAAEAAESVEEVATVEEVTEPVVEEVTELGRDDDHADEIYENNANKPASTGTELGEATSGCDLMEEADGKPNGLDDKSGENEQSDGAGTTEVGNTLRDRMADEGMSSGLDDDVVSEERIDIVQLLLSKGVIENGVSSDDGDIGDIPLYDVGDTHDSLDSGERRHEGSTEKVADHNDDKLEKEKPKSRG
jgi:hypothetical protein